LSDCDTDCDSILSDVHCILFGAITVVRILPLMAPHISQKMRERKVVGEAGQSCEEIAHLVGVERASDTNYK
jgi:hypothetical protein